MKRLAPLTAPFVSALIAATLAGCDKPTLRTENRSEQGDKVVSTTEESQSQSVPGEIVDGIEKTMPSEATPAVKSAPRAPTSEPSSRMSDQERFARIARAETMMEAQLAGIQTIESDLGRHTAILNELKRQLQAVKASQAAQKSGSNRVRIERVAGQSTLVDRRAQAAELEAKIHTEQPMVTQLSVSLQNARRKYEEMRVAMDRLRWE